MKKHISVLCMACSMLCSGYFYNGDNLITFNEPITVRVMDVYVYGFSSRADNEVLNYNYGRDIVLTNVIDGTAFYNYTIVENDYQMSLTPNSYGYTMYELGDKPDTIGLTRRQDRWTESCSINCKRVVGYLFNDRWIDKNGNDITDIFNSYIRLSETRQAQHNARVNPSIQLNSRILVLNNEPAISFDIVYSGEKVVWGKKQLTDSEWVDVTDLDKSEFRFFKVSIKSN